MGNVANCCEKRENEIEGVVDLGSFKKRPKKKQGKDIKFKES